MTRESAGNGACTSAGCEEIACIFYGVILTCLLSVWGTGESIYPFSPRSCTVSTSCSYGYRLQGKDEMTEKITLAKKSMT